MQEHQTLPSLLGTLNPSGNPIHLNLALGKEAHPPDLEQRIPFFLVSDSDPLTRLYRARFETEAGSLIRTVFLLMQKDRYRQAASPLGRLSNRDVELFWQNAAEQLREASPELRPILLSGETDAGGKPLPFRSLFFCRSRGLYFHPPCPQCGLELALCRDDQRLASHRLQAYSTSLSRYLHCPHCSGSGEAPVFYAYEPDSFDPPIVKDRLGLVQEWSHMAQRGVTSSGFPCPDCAQAGTCLKSPGQLQSAIIPFAFYPFHLLAFESMTFHAPDFLCLASGGAREELRDRLIQRGEMGKVHHLEVELRRESDQHGSPFFFRGSLKFFLEVLYLKLAFLAEVARGAIFDRGGPGLVDLVGSLDRIWVKLPSQSSSLPHFWNFQVRFVDIFRGAPGVPPQLKLPPAYALHLMGVLWLTALVTNRSQESPAIQQAIDVFYNDRMQAPEDGLDGGGAACRSSPVFAPGNVFWSPEELELPEAWETLWLESLNLGWSLMRASYRMSDDWSPERFQSQLAGLCEKVKEELFSSAPRQEPVRESEDTALAAILSDLLKKWVAREPPPKVLPAGRTTYLERETTAISELETLPLDLAEGIPEEWAPETVILSPSSNEATQAAAAAVPVSEPPKRPAPGVSAPTGDLGLDDTMALRGKEEVLEEEKEEEILPETIILSPVGESKGQKPAPPQQQQTPSPPEPGEPSDELEPAEAQQPRPASEADDLLMETVILSPRKDKDK